jgi:hypothetical protein
MFELPFRFSSTAQPQAHRFVTPVRATHRAQKLTDCTSARVNSQSLICLAHHWTNALDLSEDTYVFHGTALALWVHPAEEIPSTLRTPPP